MKKNITLGFVTLTAILITTFWLFHTPPGIKEKAFAVGSSVCHQIPSHSFEAAGIQFPLCARCSGLYLGTFIGLVYYLTLGKRKALPKKGYILLLVFFFLVWAGDGINSFLSDFLNKPLLYETTNMIRLVTGFGMGLVMSTALMTLFNLTAWKEGKNSPLLVSPLQVAAYALVSALLTLVLFSENATIFQILAYISIVTVLIIITLLYTIFWIIINKKENSFTKWNSLAIFITAGFATAMLQVTLLNMLRQWVIR